MTYEMVREPRYEAVRFNDAGRERWLIVRSGDTAPVVVAESPYQTSAVLIAEALDAEVEETPPPAPPHDSNSCHVCQVSTRASA